MEETARTIFLIMAVTVVYIISCALYDHIVFKMRLRRDEKQQKSLKTTAGHIAYLMELEPVPIIRDWKPAPLAYSKFSSDWKTLEYIGISRHFLQSLNHAAIEAVLAHEFAHSIIKSLNRDIEIEKKCDLLAAKIVGKKKVLLMYDAIDAHCKKFNYIPTTVNARRVCLQNAEI